jgi:hypothetical protein
MNDIKLERHMARLLKTMMYHWNVSAIGVADNETVVIVRTGIGASRVAY